MSFWNRSGRMPSNSSLRPARSGVIARRHCEWAAGYGEWLARADFTPTKLVARRVAGQSRGIRSAQSNRGPPLGARRWRRRVACRADRRFDHWNRPCRRPSPRRCDAAAGRGPWRARPRGARLWLSLSGFAHGENVSRRPERPCTLLGRNGDRSHWLGNGLAAMQEAALDAGLPRGGLGRQAIGS